MNSPEFWPQQNDTSVEWCKAIRIWQKACRLYWKLEISLLLHDVLVQNYKWVIYTDVLQVVQAYFEQKYHEHLKFFSNAYGRATPPNLVRRWRSLVFDIIICFCLIFGSATVLFPQVRRTLLRGTNTTLTVPFQSSICERTTISWYLTRQVHIKLQRCYIHSYFRRERSYH